MPTDLVLVLAIPMVIIHAATSLISLRYITVPRFIGLPIAVYESVYYVILLTYLLLNHYGIVLLVMTTLFLLIHVGGVYLYVNGTLTYLSHKRNGLRYYGYYEIAELIFIVITMSMLIY
ncbi:hypothetical protein [Vulcanisaeta souniana]|uniref:Uncharacterized protein n=1 Tax=Vulcanisaeta souniana JCM 11219 TaxID=1293586 RepID=A0A830EN62_9CREN|nr:hypothetical protein [Vulcanisaeta souniana]GGI87302.1 hypothetical protein GCM10007112_25270 [Vulcanisaeta souniana JCM 11219]